MNPTSRVAYCSTREAAEMPAVTLRTVQLRVESGMPKAVRIFHKPAPFDQLRALCAGMIERRAACL